METYSIKNGDPTDRAVSIGQCIYCGESAIGEEHIIPQGAGGTLVLKLASCRTCEDAIKKFEPNVLNTVLYVPRVSLAVRRKRRKRPQPDQVRVHAQVDGEDIQITLPLKDYPSFFFLPHLVPPGALIDNVPRMGALNGAWVANLEPEEGFKLPAVKGIKSISSPVLDTHAFSRFLAKVAHGYAVYCLGADGFKPLLTDFILGGADETGGLYVGGSLVQPTNKPESLHELSCDWWDLNGKKVVVVTIRLFACLGSPSYLVITGAANAA